MVNNNTNHKILIIGGSGFIGSHVLKKALSKKWHVFNISLKSDIDYSNSKNLIHKKLDILNLEKLKDNISNIKFDYVINMSGYIDHTTLNDDKKDIIKQHFLGLQNIVKSLNRELLKNFIQIGSSLEYGNSVAPHLESFREQSSSPYAFAKTANTHFLQMLQLTENFPCNIARLYQPYGPGQNKDKLIPHIINSCLNDKEFQITEGHQIRDFCYIEDIVDAIFKILLTKKIEGEIFNVSSGIPIKIKDLIFKIQKIIGKGKALFGSLAYRHNESMSCYADITKINKTINWYPKTNLEEGINKTIQYYNSFK